MARRNVRTVETFIQQPARRGVEPEPVVIAPEEAGDFGDSSVGRFLIERAGGVADATVKVFKAGGAGSGGGRNQGVPNVRDAFLYECPPDEFSEGALQESYGEGTYRIKMYGTHPDGGNYGMLVNRLIEIGPAPKWKPAPTAQPQTLGAVTVQGSGGEVARAIAEVLAPVMQQMQSRTPTRAEMLAEMKTMAEIFRPATSATPSASGGIKETLELLSLAKGVLGSGGDAGALDGESGPWAVLLEAVRNFGPQLGEVLKQKTAGKAQPAALPSPDAAAQVTEPAISPEEEEMNLLLSAQLTMFHHAAKTDADPEEWGALLYEKAPPELLAALQSEEWFDALCKIDPKFSAFKPWCEKVRDVVLEELKLESEEANAAAPPAVAAATAKPTADLTKPA